MLAPVSDFNDEKSGTRELGVVYEGPAGRSVLDVLGSRYSLLTDVARLLIRETDLDVLTRAAADRMQGLLEFARLSVVYVSRDGRTYDVHTVIERRKDVPTSPILGVPSDAGLIGHALKTRRTTYVPDTTTLSVEHVDPHIRDLCSLLLLPMNGTDGLVGALVIGALRPDGFTRADIKSARQIADFLALATERQQRIERGDAMQRDLAEKSNRLEAAVARLEATNLELDTFIYSASHDLRGPLLSIAGLTDLARLALATGNQSELTDYLDRIQRNVRKLDNVVVDILQVSRARRMDRTHEPTLMHKLIGEVVELVGVMDDADAVDISIKCKVKRPLEIERLRVRQILNNLLTNGLKYRDTNRDDCFVRVHCDVQDGELLIRVSDNGIGIPVSKRERVFEMFFRASNQSFGSGLGLYLVKQHADAMGATVTVEYPEQGTTFEVRIPLP